MTNTDFDFLAGSWVGRQRRRVKILADCDEWYEFDATLEMSVHLDGNATFDVLRSPERDLEGLTLRLYSPQEQVWRIWWASKATGGRLDEPVVGRFDGSVGTFECDDRWEDKPVRVRYTWSEVDTEHPQWEQAFSPDGGATWEVNWTSSWRRVE
jgi:hypothetical protein